MAPPRSEPHVFLMSTAERLSAALADRYRIERELGQGGMATVYLAHDLRHDRKVAIKVLKPELAAVLGAERFVQEIKTTAALSHPHILPLFDSGETDGFLYYVMPFIEGETIREKLNRETQCGIDEAVRISCEVADALDYAHRHGVIHRDIKPENILLHDGRPMVMDFGIALAVSAAAGGRMTETGLSLGTPHYMSPEQATADKSITGRSDVYSLAAVLYEMFAGEPPHLGNSAQQIIMKIVTDVPRPVRELRRSVPTNVSAALAKALEKLPADRFESAAKFADALRNPTFTIDGATAGALAQPQVRAFRWWIRSPWSWVTLAALAAVAISTRLPSRTRAPASIAGIRPVRITHSGGVGCAAISPDGRDFAAILGGYSEETECVGKLVIRGVPTGVDQELLPGVVGVRRLRWSPSGSMLLFNGKPDDKPSGLWIVPRGSGAPRLLTSAAVATFGFVDDQRVFTMGPSGPQLLDATSGEVVDSLPSLRGRTHLFSHEYPSTADWSPDGKRVVAQDVARGDVAFVLTASGAITDSLTAIGASHIDGVYWAGPGRVIYYLNHGFGPGDLLMRDLDVETGRFRSAPTIIWGALPVLRGVTSTAQGDRVMVLVRAVVDEQHVMQLNARANPRVLVRSLNAYLGEPHFSPDGTRIAYSREDALGFNPYWIGVDGGAEHPVSSDTTPTPGAEWIDDRRIMTASTSGARAEVDLETGRVRRLADSAVTRLLDYLGDRRLWRTADSLHLILTDEQGKLVRDLGAPPGLQAIRSHWLPTPSYLVVAGPTRDQPLAMVGYSFTTSGWSNPVPLNAREGMRIAGAGSDGTIYFALLNGGRTEIWRSRDYTSKPTPLLTLPVHCYNWSVMVSLDGKRVVCNVTTSEPDAWVLDLHGRD